MLKVIAAWAALAIVVGVFVGATTALTETPEEEAQKREQAAAAARERALAKVTPAEEIARRLAAIRGLEFDGPPPEIRVVPDRELATQAVEADAAQAEQAGGAEAQAIERAATLLLAHAGAVAPDAIQKAEQGAGEAAIARFVPGERVVLLAETVLARDPRLAEAAVVHELARALDDQAFDPAARHAAPLRDAESAEAAVREGSATRAETLYAAEHLGGDGEQVGDVRRREDQEDPEPLLAYAHFPSTSGERYVAGLYEDGLWAAVDERLREPPAATRAVLHAGTGAGEGEVEPTVLEPGQLLPDELDPVATTAFGELDTVALLRSGLREDEARDVAAGWRGGQATVWSVAGECPPPCRPRSASLVVVRWAGEAEARAFAGAWRRAFEQATEAAPEGGRAWVVDDGGAALVRAGTTTALAFAADVRRAGGLATQAAQSGG